MWCLISQPNSVIIEVRVDPKAIGQECLEKVSVLYFQLFFIKILFVFCIASIYRPARFFQKKNKRDRYLKIALILCDYSFLENVERFSKNLPSQI